MAANPHLSTETLTAGSPDADVAAVLVHGRDQDADFMRPEPYGAELHIYDDQEHGVNDDEIVAVRTLLTDLLERSA